jgi:hypothetical protein
VGGELTTPLTDTDLLAGVWGLFESDFADESSYLVVSWLAKRAVVVVTSEDDEAALSMLAALTSVSWTYGGFGDEPDYGSAQQLADGTDVYCALVRRETFNVDDYPNYPGAASCGGRKEVDGVDSLELAQLRTADLAPKLITSWRGAGYVHLQDVPDTAGGRPGQCLYSDIGTAASPRTQVRCVYPESVAPGNVVSHIDTVWTLAQTQAFFATDAVVPLGFLEAN